MATTAHEPAIIREADRPGDLGAVAALHGVLYTREYGMDATMEAYVAAGMAELVLARAREGGTAPGRLWVAELGGRVVGATGLVRAEERPGWGQLRWVILDPVARGRGLGRRLLETALDEARARSYEGVLLWTIAGLDAAHHLYAKAGFELTVSRPVHKFGLDTVEQRMDLRF
ncbi:GNAT family N-acetyltransferase [Streptomyces kaniharaensis]|uniref:GNAT family N-acetyltransferase n=1 Tax=Streptomyces kaniharaensis TaxID=212423 RepID=A0A6N7KMW5_9ACTN|nr:GNAT family N-acetyltransferase [Streptomyces kaniharaensis]MQS12836.1 GNAT family N-acetyltransferase [Streptomyces kaniharaensis]